jgi:hypothetical protein
MSAGSSAAAAATATATTLSDDDVFPNPRNAASRTFPTASPNDPTSIACRCARPSA